jgi:hypothetical protein
VTWEAAVVLPVVRLGLAVFPFGTLQKSLAWYARTFRGVAPASAPDPRESVARAVNGDGRRVPEATTRLAQALTAQTLLVRRGLPAELRIGVRQAGAGNAPRIEAHAWVECHGRVVVGDHAELAQYTRLSPATMSRINGLARLLGGDAGVWRDMGLGAKEFVELCAAEDLLGQVRERMAATEAVGQWPAGLRERLGRRAPPDTAVERARNGEVRRVLAALDAAGVQPLLLKGTALAYSVYPHPSHRPRGDTDLLIRRSDEDRVRSALSGLGYSAPLHSDGDLIFRQFHLVREDEQGILHTMDFHWQISSQAAFADVFSYDALMAASEALPDLGPSARAPGPAESLVLACIHPVMHHRNEERLLWVHDIHLLAGRLDAAGWRRAVDHAIEGRVAAVCLDALARAGRFFGTRVPDAALQRLAQAAGAGEASAEYLEPGRTWWRELRSNLRALPGWRSRLRLAREVAFPRPGYMLEAYGLRTGALGVLALPFLYLHRGLRGAWKVLRARK